MKILKAVVYFPYILFLDIISVPAIFMNKKRGAQYHLFLVCPICPKFRRSFRDVDKDGTCWWEKNWKKGNYGIPKSIGLVNFLRIHIGLKAKFRDI